MSERGRGIPDLRRGENLNEGKAAGPGGRETPLYERMARRAAPGAALRPGGPELTARAIERCAFPREAILLDLGCGTGGTVGALASGRGFRCVGLDPSAPLLAMGRERDSGLTLVRGRGEDLPFGDGSFDGVFLECVLSVAAEPDRVLAEAFRVLRPGGRLVLSDVYARSREGARDLARFAAEGCLRGAFVLGELEATLTGTGFTTDFFEDRTRDLKEFAARLILSGGFPGDFWCRSCGAGGEDPGRALQAVSAARPGYFCLIARKEGVRSAGERPRFEDSVRLREKDKP